MLGAPSGKDDVSVDFPWQEKRLSFPPVLCVRAQTGRQQAKRQGAVLRRRSCCLSLWSDGAPGCGGAWSSVGMAWRAVVFGMVLILCVFTSSLTQPAVPNAFQPAGLCWCGFGDFGELGFSTLCFGRFVPTALPHRRALIQTEGGK